MPSKMCLGLQFAHMLVETFSLPEVPLLRSVSRGHDLLDIANLTSVPWIISDCLNGCIRNLKVLLIERRSFILSIDDHSLVMCTRSIASSLPAQDKKAIVAKY